MLARALACLTLPVTVCLSVTMAAKSFAAPSAGVAIVRSVDWAIGDTARDGAGEFAIFLCVAQLQQTHRSAGLVAIGDHNGLLRSGGERALRRLVFTGVAIVKLTSPNAAGGCENHELFLYGGSLGADAASDVLTGCLQRYGAPPVAADPDKPTPREVSAIRAHLQPFQSALALAAAESLAQR